MENEKPVGIASSYTCIFTPVKIELVQWNHTCGDGCCYDYGVDLYVNGERLTQYAEQDLQETLQQIFDKLGIKAEIEYR